MRIADGKIFKVEYMLLSELDESGERSKSVMGSM